MRSVRVALHAHKWIDSGRVLSAKLSRYAHVSRAGNSDTIFSGYAFSQNRDNAERRILSASFGSRSRQPFDYINEEIEYPFVHVVDVNNDFHRDIPIEDALEMAEAVEMDLVQVAEPKNGIGPAICRLLDANKRMFELKKGVNKAAKDKEITLTPKIATHDLDVKVRRIKSFLKKGSTVRVTARWHHYENLLEKAEEKMSEITEKLLEVGKTNSSKQVENTLKLVFVPCKTARNSD